MAGHQITELGHRVDRYISALRGFRISDSKVVWEPLEPRILMSVEVTPLPLHTGSDIPGIIVSLPAEQTQTDNWVKQPVRIASDHGDLLDNVLLGSFTPSEAIDISRLTAQIDWGDGTSGAGTILQNEEGGFDVFGTHRYGFGRYVVSVGVTDSAQSSGPAHELKSFVDVMPPPLAGQGKTITATAGQSFRGVVATFVGIDLSRIDLYSVSIAWGDGEYSAGSLRVLEDGTVQVIGQHDYTRQGQFDINVSLSVSQPATATPPNAWSGQSGTILDTIFPYAGPWNALLRIDVRGIAQVAPGAVVGVGEQPEYITGVPVHDTIATFDIVDGESDLSHYHALLELPGSTTMEGRIERLAPDSFAVVVDHTFLNIGGGRYTVRIMDDRLPEGSQQVGRVSGNLSIGSHLAVNAVSFRAVAGREFDGKVADLSADGADLWNSSFAITIDWGDGTSSAGSVVATGPGRWEVRGTHTYAVVGYRQRTWVSIEAHETRTPMGTGLPTPQQPYFAEDSMLFNVEPGEFEGFTLRATNSGDDEFWYGRYVEVGAGGLVIAALLTVSDLDLLNAEYQGEVVWDDGTVGTFHLYGNSEHADTLYVYAATHFSTVGEHTGSLTITSNGLSRSVQVTAYAQPASVDPGNDPVPQPEPIAQISARPIHAFKNYEWSGLLATVTPSDPNAQPDDFVVNIAWGDGTNEVGEITRNADGTWGVYGSHTFVNETRGDHLPSFTVIVSKGGTTNHASADYTVIPKPGGLNISQVQATNIRQLEEFTATLAEFVKVIGSRDAYAVSIDWGDGSTSPGEILRVHKGFQIAGTHEYQTSGNFVIEVTIDGPEGVAITRQWIWVQHHPVKVESTPAAPEGFTVSGAVARFLDLGGDDFTADQVRIRHGAIIDWGDGTISQGQIVARADGSGFDVVGTHAYAVQGTYEVKVRVRRNEFRLTALGSRALDGVYLASGNAIFGGSGSGGLDFDAVSQLIHIGASNNSEQDVVGFALPAAQESRFSNQPIDGSEDGLLDRSKDLLDRASAELL